MTIEKCDHDWHNRVSGGSLCSKCNTWQDKRMTDHTPTTEEVREALRPYRVHPLEFDRWLYARLAQAWNEGANCPNPEYAVNPYEVGEK